MNSVIEKLKASPKMVLTKNLPIASTDVDALSEQLKGKRSQIDAAFLCVSDLEEQHVRHFKTAPYMFRPVAGKMFAGILMDEKMDYVRIVFLSEEVLEYILNLGQPTPTPEDDFDEATPDLESCDQCGEDAWDGRICHCCGAKDI